MKRETIEKMLRDYRGNEARCRAIEAQIQDTEREIEQVRSEAASALILHTQRLDGMPKGNRVGDPTASVGGRLADGWEPEECRFMRSRIDQLRTQIAPMETANRYVDIWLDGLRSRERWAVLHHLIEGESWPETESSYQAEFGEYLSRYALKRSLRAALEKIDGMMQDIG